MALERDQVARALPGYEIGEELGRGAWGVVLAGRHRNLGRDVAIKQLPRAFAADDAVRARFVAEGRVLASLDHPHIVPVFDFVESDGLCLLVMELLPGGSVWDRFMANGFTPPTACGTALAAAAGLHNAHQHNVLHRDVKPENLMFSAEGVLKVTDFGIAKVVGGDATLATRAGEVVGTPAYIAPEQARGAALSPATDVYALATLLYELLAGELPFAEEPDAMALLFKHAYEDPVPLEKKAPAVPGPVVPVVMQGLATAPADRYSSAEAFGVALAEACTSVWGPGWLAAEGVPVMGPGSIVGATERLSVPPPGQAGPPTAGAPTAVPAPPTVVRQPPPPTLARARATVVRPASTSHAEGAVLVDLKESDLVPVQQVIKAPPGARVPLAISLASFALAVVLALVGLGAPSSLGGNLPAASVEVAGVPLSASSTLKLDLSKPVTVHVGPGAPAASAARLSVLLLGYHVYQATGQLQASPGGGSVAHVDATSAHYLLAGRLTGEIALLRAGAVVGRWRLVTQTAQSGWLSVVGLVVVVLALFSLAYIEQFLRALWRGRRRFTATVGLGPSAALLAVAVVGAAWLAAGRQPSLASLVACAVLGAVSGFAAAPAARRAGRLRRLRRRAARRAAV
jgi:serine/threonine-protein kinase